MVRRPEVVLSVYSNYLVWRSDTLAPLGEARLAVPRISSTPSVVRALDKRNLINAFRDQQH